MNTIQKLQQLIRQKQWYIEHYPDALRTDSVRGEIAILSEAIAALREAAPETNGTPAEITEGVARCYAKVIDYAHLAPMGMLYYHHFGIAHEPMLQRLGSQIIIKGSNIKTPNSLQWYITENHDLRILDYEKYTRQTFNIITI